MSPRDFTNFEALIFQSSYRFIYADSLGKLHQPCHPWIRAVPVQIHANSHAFILDPPSHPPERHLKHDRKPVTQNDKRPRILLPDQSLELWSWDPQERNDLIEIRNSRTEFPEM
jgi:hypothetical protein